jgi:hypothetical protein
MPRPVNAYEPPKPWLVDAESHEPHWVGDRRGCWLSCGVLFVLAMAGIVTAFVLFGHYIKHGVTPWH